MGRIVERAGTRRPGAATPASLFPSPGVLATANLAGLGLTAARAETLARLAAAVAEGTVRLDGSRDTAVFVEEMTALRGIGSWTAQYVAMRGLGDPDAFPAEDLGLRAAAGRLANGTPVAAGSRVSTRTLLEQAEAWRPWRAYAAIHLWNM
jgi:3-methyladenine DNA glycosylase/8-oxoguanine DNA glycosylase